MLTGWVSPSPDFIQTLRLSPLASRVEVYEPSAAVQVISVVIRAAGHTRIIALVWGLPGLVTVLISIPIFLTGSLRGVVSIFALSYWLALAIALWKGIGPMMSERGMETTESRSAVG